MPSDIDFNSFASAVLDEAEQHRTDGGTDTARDARNPLDPLLLRLTLDYTDGDDLSDRLAKLFQVQHSA